jgi:hypothetical protein
MITTFILQQDMYRDLNSSGWGESNPSINLGKVVYYRCMTAALNTHIIPEKVYIGKAVCIPQSLPV